MSGIVLLSTLILYKVDLDNVLEGAKDDQLRMANLFAREVESRISARIDHTDRLATLLMNMDLENKDAVTEFLQKQYFINSDIELGYLLISKNGTATIAEAPVVENRSTLSFIESEWFLKALETEDVVISSPRFGRVSGSPIIILAKAIRDEEGEVKAVLSSPVLLSAEKVLQNFFTRENMTGDSILIVSRADGVFIVPPFERDILDPVPEKGINELHDKAMEGFEGTGVTIDAFGEKNIAAFSNINLLDWFIVSRISAEEAFAVINRHAKIFAFNALFMIALATAIIVFFLRFYFEPLRAASEKVQKMASSEIELEMLHIKRNDEVGVLLIGFNKLVETVRNRTKELEILSQVDGLTKLNNIRHMNSIMDLKWKEFRRRSEPLSIIMIDIDHFKKYNDHFGHQKGDLCLVKVSETMRIKLARPTDVIARYGGEEFIVLVEGDESMAARTAEYIRQSVKELAILHPLSPFKIVTISLGVASCVPGKADSIESLIKEADTALYKSKENGRDRYTIFSDI